MIIIEKFLLKIMFITIERNFLKENRITLTKQCLFELVIKELFIFKEIKNVDNRLIIFVKVKNVNNYSICVLSFDFNKFNMILFMNVIFENVKNEIYKLSKISNLCNPSFD